MAKNIIEEHLSTWLEGWESSRPDLLAYHREFEKLPVIGSEIRWHAQKWIIDDLVYNSERGSFDVVVRRIQDDGSTLRKLAKSEKVRRDLFGNQVVSESFLTTTMDWINVFQIPAGILVYGSYQTGPAVSGALLDSTASGNQIARLTQQLVNVGAWSSLAYFTGNYVFGLLHTTEPAVVLDIGSLRSPPGSRQYNVLHGITQTPGFTGFREGIETVYEATGQAAGNIAEGLKSAASATGSFITKSLETAVLIGIVGVLYKIFTLE